MKTNTLMQSHEIPEGMLSVTRLSTALLSYLQSPSSSSLKSTIHIPHSLLVSYFSTYANRQTRLYCLGN